MSYIKNLNKDFCRRGYIKISPLLYHHDGDKNIFNLLIELNKYNLKFLQTAFIVDRDLFFYRNKYYVSFTYHKSENIPFINELINKRKLKKK